MGGKARPRTPAAICQSELISLEAEPSPLDIDLKRTGLIIIDMQNAFLEKGAYFDLKGYDVSSLRKCIEPIQQIVQAVRSKDIKVIYIFTTHHPNDDGGGPESAYWHKEVSLALYRKHPEYKDKLLLPGTWGTKIVKELTPQADDEIVEKPRYSGFFNTKLDTVLKRHNLKYLLVTGIVTNCCVEATIRDAYYRGYSAIMVTEATAPTGPSFMQEAATFNITTYFGWVASIKDVLKLIHGSSPA